MNAISSNLNCPSCDQTLQPKVLECKSCEIRVEGPFVLNEFAKLSQEDLHFLRIFIHCEGRVRDMEPSLGLSYPTIRNRIAELKGKLLPLDSGTSAKSDSLTSSSQKPEAKAQESVGAVLARLEKGEITFERAQELIRSLK